MHQLMWIQVAAVSAAAAFGAGTSLLCLRYRQPPADLLGLAGARREAALRGMPGFLIVEPLLRNLGGWLAPLVPHRWRASLDQSLGAAGHPLGLSAGELLASAALSGALGAAVGAACAQSLGRGGWPAVVAGGLLLGALPLRRVAARGAERRTAVDRDLPAMLELVAMAMQAGLDFSAALQQVTGTEQPRSALIDEVSLVQDALRLGHTRRQALEEFAVRVPTASVRQLVAAIVQAEDAGSPLAAVLRTQASALRARRSVLAEEAAARAALMLTFPMMLMLCCLMLLLVGPTVLGSAGK